MMKLDIRVEKSGTTESHTDTTDDGDSTAPITASKMIHTNPTEFI